MTFESRFCSSPWFHMRIMNDGTMNYCRWSSDPGSGNIRNQLPGDFFQDTMQPLRDAMLKGQVVDHCSPCAQMEQYHKVSGRQRQLLKIGVDTKNFVKTLASSPWIPILNQRPYQQQPQDWQIDLGNYCNSACVFCSPKFSSRMAVEQLRLGMITQLPPSNWAQQPELMSRFLQTLDASSEIKYLHFIGGETVLIPAFEDILQALCDRGLNRTATIGFTTNLTVWPQHIIDLLNNFHGVNLGMSVEAFAPINDYVRYPSQLAVVEENFTKWIEHARQQGWYCQIRTTPTALTLKDLLTVYDRAWQTGTTIESCNFLQEPEFLQPSVLPMHLRRDIVDNMQAWLETRQIQMDTIVNTRDPYLHPQQICQDLQSYIHYLVNEPDHSDRLPSLIKYLQRIESVRKNSIINYRPEYAELFRTHGYQT